MNSSYLVIIISKEKNVTHKEILFYIFEKNAGLFLIQQFTFCGIY